MKVFAEFIQEKEKTFRRKTLLQFGDSTDLIGSIILINPGSSSPIGCDENDRENIKDFYKKIHGINEDTENWQGAGIDPTMHQIKKIFDGSYLGETTTKPLNGIIQLFNCFYYKHQHLSNALNEFSVNSTYNFNELNLLKDRPVYFGWGNTGKYGEVREIAKNIFSSYDKSLTPIYKDNFIENCFYHPGYVNRSFKKNNKTKNILISFYETLYNIQVDDKSIDSAIIS